MFVLVLLVLLVVGTPIGIAFALVILLGAEAWNIRLEFAASTTLDALQSYPFLAIPLFLLAGELMTRGGLVRQLVAVCDMVLGRARAPLGLVMIGASGLMGAITGSSVATVAAIGTAIGPEMARRGYAPGYIGALNATAGLLGVLIPPSIPLILYGSVVGASITQLFLATALPGLLFVILFMVVHLALAGRALRGGRETRDDPASEGLHASRRGPRATLLRSTPALVLPVLVLGGIYSGVFTPTEAAAVAVIYALLVMVFDRATKLGDLHGVFARAATSAAAIMFVIGFTSVFNRAMVLEQIPQAIAAFASASTSDPVVFLLAVNAALLVIGMFMETSAATLLMGPLLAPAASAFGVDPIHFGIIVVINIELGLLTPPLATNLYVAAMTNRVSLVSMLPFVGWFLAASLGLLMAITFVPGIALWYRF